MRREKMEKKQIALRLPIELYKQIAHHAVDTDTNVHHCILNLLALALAQVTRHEQIPSPSHDELTR